MLPALLARQQKEEDLFCVYQKVLAKVWVLCSVMRAVLWFTALSNASSTLHGYQYGLDSESHDLF